MGLSCTSAGPASGAVVCAEPAGSCNGRGMKGAGGGGGACISEGARQAPLLPLPLPRPESDGFPVEAGG
eukprot:6258358-Amphidinium_carterae.1